MRPIFDSLDYRTFLRDYYAYHKQENGLSLRGLASQLGFASAGSLKLVMDGKRNLGKESIVKIVSGLKLKKKEAEYFSCLILFNQARTSVEKNYHFGLLSSFRTKSSVTAINADQYEYYRHWYIPVIRELIIGKPADFDAAALAAMVRPPILPKQAKKAVALLEKLGFIRVNQNRLYEHAEPFIATEREVRSLAVRNFHKEMLVRAQEAVEDVPVEERDVSSVTARISHQGFTRIKQRIQEFRDELMQIIRDDADTDRVYQINFQLFPVSQPDPKTDEEANEALSL